MRRGFVLIPLLLLLPLVVWAQGSSVVSSSIIAKNGILEPGPGDGMVAEPTFSPVGGIYTSTQTVTISDTTSGATICYTTDGSTPTEVSNACSGGTTQTYSSALTVSSSGTIKALATKAGYADSYVDTGIYFLEGTFGTIATASNTSCSTGSSCAITVTSTGAGDAGVIAMYTSTAPPNGIVSATGCQTSWGVVRGAVSLANASDFYQDWAYCPKLTGGTTSITVTFWTSITTPALVFWDAPTTTQAFFDTGNGVYDSTGCTSCAGTPLTINLSNDGIFTWAIPENSLTAVSTPYVADQSFPGGSGMAHLLNTTSGTAPTWTQNTSGPMVSSSIALGNYVTGPAIVKAYGYTTHTSGTTVSINYTPEYAGDVLQVLYGAIVSSGTCSISDGVNTYIVPTLNTGSNPFVISTPYAATIYYAYVASVSASAVTITATCPTDTNRAIIVAELHGVHTLDQSGMATETTTTGGAYTGPNFTTTSYPELVVGVTVCDEYCSSGSGWSQLTGDSDGSIFMYLRALSGVVTEAVSGADNGGTGETEIVGWMTWK